MALSKPNPSWKHIKTSKTHENNPSSWAVTHPKKPMSMAWKMATTINACPMCLLDLKCTLLCYVVRRSALPESGSCGRGMGPALAERKNNIPTVVFFHSFIVHGGFPPASVMQWYLDHPNRPWEIPKKTSSKNPPVNIQKTIEHGSVEIVDLTIKRWSSIVM